VRRLLLIGIGTGNLDHLTLEAVAALNEASVVLVLDKREETADLTAFRRRVCARHVRGRTMRVVAARDPTRDRTAPYEAAVEAWHAARAELVEDLIAREVPEGGTGAVLVWGDPSLYDSTIRIVDRILARGRLALAHAMIPGVSSPAVLAARHRIALNRIGGAVHVTTGRRLAAGWPADADDVVVMLDGAETFRRFLGQDLTIHWGAYLGSAEEILVAGPLDAVADAISARRAEARARLGWIMDVYRLSRPG
jgi:precorrin-6A synthase